MLISTVVLTISAQMLVKSADGMTVVRQHNSSVRELQLSFSLGDRKVPQENKLDSVQLTVRVNPKTSARTGSGVKVVR